MKYIRTKDENNLIIDLTNMQLPYNLTDEYIDFNKFGMFKIIKQADTIKELCDKVIKIRTSKNGQQTHLFFNITDLPLLKEQFIKYKGDCPVYLAIWTDKGLIYVAKMNDKGELELL